MVFSHSIWRLRFEAELFGIHIQFVVAGISPPDDEQSEHGIMEGGAR